MHIPVKKILILLAFAVNIGLTVFGFATLLDSPYIGLRMGVCGDHACVKSVDEDSPADGKVQPKDHLLQIDDLRMPYFVFSSDPDYISSRSDQRTFWELQRTIGTQVVRERRALFTFIGNGQPKEVPLSPRSFPATKAIVTTLPQYIIGWTFIVIAYLVLRKKDNHLSTVNFVIGVFAGSAFITLAPYSARDIAFSYVPFKILTVVNYITTQIFCYALLHMALIFPRKKVVLQRHPDVAVAPYVLLAIVAMAHFAELFENTHLTTYMSMNACMLTTLGVFVFGFLRERNPVYRKQIQWVVIGSLAGISSWLVMTSLPIMFGIPHLAQEISILPTVIYPLSFAFAITKYRLMEIDSILDTAVIYGFTIAILAGIETAFLSFASPYILRSGHSLPYFTILAVLLIVFIYVPVRNFIKDMVERLFKRGKYDPEKEIQRFTVSLGLCDERSALEKFTAFVNGLLKPSGIALFKITGDTASVIGREGGRTTSDAGVVLSQAARLWMRVRNRGASAFGYELDDHGVLDASTAAVEMENALFVPFITDPNDRTSGYLAVLLKKWNGTAYSAKDVMLMNAVSVNIANIIEAGELRKERAVIEERHRKEKDAVMKELHDGLGNILTSVTVTSQAAERMLDKNESKAKELVNRIGEFSAEAMDFMRTGLMVMDNPQGELGAIMDGVKDRYSNLLESAGMELKIELGDEADRFRPGAVTALSVTRVIQEALSNILRHSGARSVTIRTVKKGDGFAVTISDDGNGFLARVGRTGRGLAYMRRRIEDIGGAFAVESLPGKGTEIGFSVPAAGTQEKRTEHAPGDR